MLLPGDCDAQSARQQEMVGGRRHNLGRPLTLPPTTTFDCPQTHLPALSPSCSRPARNPDSTCHLPAPLGCAPLSSLLCVYVCVCVGVNCAPPPPQQNPFLQLPASCTPRMRGSANKHVSRREGGGGPRIWTLSAVILLVSASLNSWLRRRRRTPVDERHQTGPRSSSP